MSTHAVARLRRPLMLLCLAALAACGERGAIHLHPEVAGVGTQQPILVVSSRGPDDGPGIFGRSRSEDLLFARFVISVPPERAPGTVSWPGRAPVDPRTEFLTVSAHRLSGAPSFIAAVDAEMARRPPGTREATVFTHGFNSNFAEGLYRQAQMRTDFAMPGVSVHYSWPSAGRLSGYAFDRESAIFARDGLEDVLSLLARTRTERVILGAHSMGALVAMEALRQMALRGDARVFRQLQAIVLMNPDLDVDVFRRQMMTLVPYDVPVYIFVSGGDRALWASSLIRGRQVRLGSLIDAAAIADLPVTLIDVTAVGDGGDALDHMAVATSPTMIAMIAGMRELGPDIFADELRGPGLLEGTVNVLQNATSLVLEPLIAD